MLLFGTVGVAVGTPLAIVAGGVATWVVRRAAAHVERLWVAAAIVTVGVTSLTIVAFGNAIASGGDGAARSGDRVAFAYAVRNHSGHDDHTLDIRSYWNGEVAGGSSSGSVGLCTSGTDSVHGSDWGLWVRRGDDAVWMDRPTGTPLVGHADFGDGPVRVTITIAQDGEVSWRSGVSGDGC